MPDTETAITDLTSQYTAQVAGDLESNTKEQDRIGAEIEALQEQLRALQHDHIVLTNMQEALGARGLATQPAPEEPAASSVPRQKTVAQSGAGKRVRAQKAAAAQGGEAVRKPAPKNPEAATQTTLVELIRRHLADQREPRSAAEIATALGQDHPDRTIKTTVVRTTVEGLVAKSHVQRAKQGNSVYYTTADATEPTSPTTAPADDQPEAN